MKLSIPIALAFAISAEAASYKDCPDVKNLVKSNKQLGKLAKKCISDKIQDEDALNKCAKKELKKIDDVTDDQIDMMYDCWETLVGAEESEPLDTETQSQTPETPEPTETETVSETASESAVQPPTCVKDLTKQYKKDKNMKKLLKC